MTHRPNETRKESLTHAHRGTLPLNDGRQKPVFPGPPKPGTDSLAELNIAKGSRIRVLKDNGRRLLVGLEGVVTHSYPGGVVVELENDPLLRFRATQAGGITTPIRTPRRNFRVTEVERIE